MSHQRAHQKNMNTTNPQHSNIALVATMTTVSVAVDVATNVRRRPRILLGVTGSVAAVQVPVLSLLVVHLGTTTSRLVACFDSYSFW